MDKDAPVTHRTQLPEGYKAFAINCGVRKYRPDVGVIFSERPASAVAVYTKNTFFSNHIRYCRQILPSDELRAIVCNSGQANTATGELGYQDNLEMIAGVAKLFDLKPKQVASASTGIIGARIALDKILKSFSDLPLHKSSYVEGFATAIMTTDLVPKAATTVVKLSKGDIRITGASKGSGMIHPNMATMLGFLMTDAIVSTKDLTDCLKHVVDETFNMISVDGETSPNDTVFAMANGASSVALESNDDKTLFLAALKNVAQQLAKSIARDGEGATKLLNVHVRGMHDLELARRVARSIVVSPLVKTAVHGGDPNWGRIYSRVGQEGVPFELVQGLDLTIGEALILKGGQVQALDYHKIRMGLSDDDVHVTLDFHAGPHSATAWGCDLTKKYVDINTEYN